MPTSTIELDSHKLESIVSLLKSEGESLKVSRLERNLHRTLKIYLWSFIVIALFIGIAISPICMGCDNMAMVMGIIFVLLVLVAPIVAVMTLVLGYSVFRRFSRIHELGMGESYRSLLGFDSNGRQISQAIRILIPLFGVLLVVHGLWQLVAGDAEMLSLFTLSIGGLLISQFFINQTAKRLEMLTNIDSLRANFTDLQKASVPSDTNPIPVPTKVLEQAAKIESEQISRSRIEAVAQGRKNAVGYAVQINSDIARTKSQLDSSKRLELENIIENLAITPRPANVTSDDQSGKLTLPIPEIGLQLTYAVNDNASRIELADLGILPTKSLE